MVQIRTISFSQNKWESERLYLLLNLMTKQPFQNINTKCFFIQKGIHFLSVLGSSYLVFTENFGRSSCSAIWRVRLTTGGAGGAASGSLFLKARWNSQIVASRLLSEGEGPWKEENINSRPNPATILSHLFSKVHTVLQISTPFFHLGRYSKPCSIVACQN